MGQPIHENEKLINPYGLIRSQSDDQYDTCHGDLFFDCSHWHTFFILAMIYNFCIIIINRFFTSDVLETIYPAVFGRFGQLMIVLFGCIFYTAYLSSHSYQIFLVLFIEKMLYFFTGIYWLIYYSHRLNFTGNPIEWLFMRIYWFGDLIFGLGFLIYANHMYHRNDKHIPYLPMDIL